MNDARLASEIQRKPKTFSFDPFVILAAERLAGTTSHGLALIREDIHGDCHVRGLVADSHERFHKFLNSSSCLESMSCDMAANMAAALSNLASTSDSVVNLSQWMKRTISVASTNAVYGLLNPFATDSRVYGAFWLVQFRLHTTLLFQLTVVNRDFEEQLAILLIGLCPKVTARRGHRGRELLAQVFGRYFAEGHWAKGSQLIRESHRSNTARGVSFEDQGRFEITTCIGLLVNTVPSLLWTLWHILSEPKLLQDLRSEILALVEVRKSLGKGGLTLVRLPISQLQSSCPLLGSTVKETLRMYSTSLSARYTTEDTLLDGQYLLKAGSFVQIPAAVVHKDRQVWGPNASNFDPSRFQSGTGLGNPEIPRAAFRPFGGGSTLCPGRSLAMIEILAFLSMFILQFDAYPEDRSMEKPDFVSMTSSVSSPLHDLHVRIRKRADFQNVNWMVG